MVFIQEKSPATNEALNSKSNSNFTKNIPAAQGLRLSGDSILFEFVDECGVLKRGVLCGRYKRLIKYLSSVGLKGATVWDATYSTHRLKYITQMIHIIRVDKGYGFNFITTTPEDSGEGCTPIARYMLTPSFKVILESEA